MATAGMTQAEKFSKALKDLTEVVATWASGKITHESAMERVREILKGVK